MYLVDYTHLQSRGFYSTSDYVNLVFSSVLVKACGFMVTNDIVFDLLLFVLKEVLKR